MLIKDNVAFEDSLEQAKTIIETRIKELVKVKCTCTLPQGTYHAHRHLLAFETRAKKILKNRLCHIKKKNHKNSKFVHNLNWIFTELNKISKCCRKNVLKENIFTSNTSPRHILKLFQRQLSVIKNSLKSTKCISEIKVIRKQLDKMINHKNGDDWDILFLGISFRIQLLGKLARELKQSVRLRLYSNCQHQNLSDKCVEISNTVLSSHVISPEPRTLQILFQDEIIATDLKAFEINQFKDFLHAETGAEEDLIFFELPVQSNQVIFKAHIKGQGGGRPGLNLQAHPDKAVCGPCAKYGTSTASRWYHKLNSTPGFISFIDIKFKLKSSDCLCQSCNLSIEKMFKNSQVENSDSIATNIEHDASTKKRKIARQCFLCESDCFIETEITDLNLFNAIFHLHRTPLQSDKIPQLFPLCTEHYNKWRSLNRIKCVMPDCQVIIKNKVYRPYNVEAMSHYFSEQGEYPSLRLCSDSPLCSRCYNQLYHLSGRLQKSQSKSVIVSNTSDLQTISCKHSEFLDSVNVSTDIEMIALTRCFLHVGNKLLMKEPLLLQEAKDIFTSAIKDLHQSYLPTNSKGISHYISKSNTWLRLELSKEFGDHIDFSTLKIRGVISPTYGTLIFRHGANVVDMLHMHYFNSKRESQQQLQNHKELEKKLDFLTSNKTASLPLADMYQKVIDDLHNRLLCQSQNFLDMFKDFDLSKLDIMKMTKDICPYILLLLLLIRFFSIYRTYVHTIPIRHVI